MFIYSKPSPLIYCLIGFLAATPIINRCEAASPEPGIEALALESGGSFCFDDLTFALLHFAPKWERTLQSVKTSAGNYDAPKNGFWDWTGHMNVQGKQSSQISIREEFSILNPQSFSLDYSVSSATPDGLPTREFSLEISLPAMISVGRTIWMDRAPLRVPIIASDFVLASPTQVNCMRLPSATGEIQISSDKPFTVRVEDMRAWKYPSFDIRVRIQFPMSGESMPNSSLSLYLEYVPGAVENLDAPLVMKPGPEWAPYRHLVGIEPGGVFDFSFMSDAPAGKHGAVVATSDGHLEFANRPSETVRFWGVNLCFTALYLDKQEADKLASRLAASGYNTVRFHHYDAGLAQKGERTDSVFNPEKLDQLDYLFYAMKRAGLYINIDLFTVRSWNFTAEEKAEMGMEFDGSEIYAFKALIPISEAAMSNWERFASSLLTHKNPYTGLTWAQDPALMGICPVNEDVLSWEKIGKYPAILDRYEKAFERWWKQPANRAKVSNNESYGRNRFLFEIHIQADHRMHDYLRSLGVDALLTGVNFLNMQGLAYVREQYDLVDNHQYWAHPQRVPGDKERLYTGFSQKSSVACLAESPRGIMQSRLWGKPYTVTEFNFLSPNQFRAEGGILIPAYASLQDWDALYNFEYASRQSYAMEGGTARTFSLTADPIGLLADRVSALLFRRGDIETSSHAVGFAINENSAFVEEDAQVPVEFTKIGLVCRIGSGTKPPQEQLIDYGLDSVVVEDSTPIAPGSSDVYHANKALLSHLLSDGILPAGSIDQRENYFRSDTGEIELWADKGSAQVIAKRCELFVLPAQVALDGDVVSVQNGASFATVSVVAVDGAPLVDSSRILVLHLTDALPSETRFAMSDRTVLDKWGTAPHLVRKGGTDIVLHLDEHANYQAWVVDATGRRVREAPFQRSGQAWVLSAETISPEGTQLAYEIVRL